LKIVLLALASLGVLLVLAMLLRVSFLTGRKMRAHEVLRQVGLPSTSRRLLSEAREILNGLVVVTDIESDDIITDNTRTAITRWLTNYEKGVN
jgi:hypothetical protein